MFVQLGQERDVGERKEQEIMNTIKIGQEKDDEKS